MNKLELFEPAMCCSTGVCGPSVDENLIRITAVMQHVRKVEGKQMVRYNLSANPNSFIRNEAVQQVLQEKGIVGLPVTVLNNDTIVKVGDYPTNQEIADWLGVSLEKTTASTVK